MALRTAKPDMNFINFKKNLLFIILPVTLKILVNPGYYFLTGYPQFYVYKTVIIPNILIFPLSKLEVLISLKDNVKYYDYRRLE